MQGQDARRPGKDGRGEQCEKAVALLYRNGHIQGKEAGVQHDRVQPCHTAGHRRPARRQAGLLEKGNKRGPQHAGLLPHAQRTWVQDIRIPENGVCHADEEKTGGEVGGGRESGARHAGEAPPGDVQRVQEVLRGTVRGGSGRKREGHLEGILHVV